jgi:hypothetical protein
MGILSSPPFAAGFLVFGGSIRVLTSFRCLRAGPVRPVLLVIAALAAATPALAQPPNNLCTSAANLSFPGTVTGTSVGSTSDLPYSSCAFTQTDDRDVWYRFTAPSAGTYRFDTNGSVGLPDTTLSIFTACPTGGAELACDDDSGDGLWSEISLAMTSGQSVRIRVAGWNHLVGGFTLRVSGGQPAPAHNECAAAAPVSPSSSVTGTNVGATGADITDCAAGDSNDVWYRLTAPIAGTYTFDTIGTGTLDDTTLAVFDACGGAELACNDDASQGEYRSRVSVVLEAGRECRVRVAGFAGSTGTFRLNTAPAVPPTFAPNDDCIGAINIASVPFTDAATDLITATEDQVVVSCDNPEAIEARAGVWSAYTPPSTRLIRLRQTAPIQTFISVFTSSNAACAGVLTERGCTDTNDLVVQAAGGVRHYILVGLAGLGTPPSPATINLSVQSLTPPANDLCTAAAAITSPGTASGTNVGASSDALASTCAREPDGNDAWFAFTPALSGVYRLDTLGSTGALDTTLSVWAGCPGAAGGGAPLHCNDDFGVDFRSALTVPLSAGQRYLVRVAGNDGEHGDFVLSVSPGVPITNDTCATARPISGQFSESIDTSFAATENAEPGARCDDEGAPGVPHSVWYRFIPNGAGPLRGSVDSTTYDQMVAVYVGFCGTFIEIACFDTEPADLGTVPIIAGQTHYLCIGAAADDPGGVSTVSLTLPSESPESGACCRGANCIVLAGEVCFGPNTVFGGGGSVCNALPNNTGPCCRADFNHTGGVTVQDVFDYLISFFGNGFQADTNGSGLSVQDLFDYLSAYFAGC